ncbi:MAG: alpha-galactosidase [Candidatus Limnocylindrales bacterium]
MPIEWDPADRQLHLHNGRLSYVVRVLEDESLGLLHFGAPLAPGRSYRHLGRSGFPGFANRLDDPIALEVPTIGGGDFRMPALVVEQADGSGVLRLEYRGQRIFPGKAPIDGLPSTYAEADDEATSVEVDLGDEPSGLLVTVSYTIFRDVPIVARHVRIRNGGSARLRVTTAMSVSLDLPDDDWTLVQLSGAWARERHITERPLAPGRQSTASQRGASGHEHDPSLVLRRHFTTETAGEACALSLVYSGNFLAEAEVGLYGTTRLRLGINPDGFAWTLEPGAEFVTPEAVLAWSTTGLGGLSDAYHQLYRERLARGSWRDRPRPILVNNWEGTYFDFDEARLVAIAGVARELGIELFVLDDGWFGARDDDASSLGDWVVDRRKLPDGIAGLARRVTDLGLQFGLWIEPEMVSPKSKLFSEHPDWAIGIAGRPRTESRQQLVLDLSRPEIVDHLVGVLSDVLASAPISYVKWDMNRNITEPASLVLPADRQGEFFHRYILGVYTLYERLSTAFPEILFESCAGGGGRFDPGMLACAPQAWTSDDTDAVERLRIQWGASLIYPQSSMAAHVSAVPNHQTGRLSPLSMRAAVAFFGVFGYELDTTALSPAERAEITGQVAFYKEQRDLFQRGRFVRLRSPFDGDGNEAAWLTVSPDRRRAIVGFYRILNRPNPGPDRLRVHGLDPELRYRVTPWPTRGDTIERDNALIRGGDDLAEIGLFLDVDRHETASHGDFWAQLFVLAAE